MIKVFTIRRYKQSDIETIIQHVKNFLSENRGDETYTNHFKSIDFDEARLYKKLNDNVYNVEFFLNIIEVNEEIVGGLCATVAQPIYSNQTIAYDQLLYTTPHYNVVRAVTELINSYVEWSKRRGVFECRLCSSTGFKQDGFSILMKRAKFQQFEIGFAKRF